jgi:hypothetical protein
MHVLDAMQCMSVLSRANRKVNAKAIAYVNTETGGAGHNGSLRHAVWDNDLHFAVNCGRMLLSHTETAF